MKLPPVRTLKWLLLPVAVAVVAVYWLRFAPVTALTHTVAAADVAGETMGTGTLEARYAASLGPRITGRGRVFDATFARCRTSRPACRSSLAGWAARPSPARRTAI